MLNKKKNTEALDNFSENLEIKGRSLWTDARIRFMRNKAAMVSLVILFAITLSVILVPMFAEFSYDDTDWYALHQAPSMEHLFGTDSLGRDLFVRTFIGGRISMMVGVLGALVAVIIGTVYGATSGFIGGRVDRLMMRFLGDFVFYSVYVSCDCIGYFFWSTYSAYFCRDWCNSMA